MVDASAQHHDFVGPGGTIPGFADSPTIVSARAGSWADASMWSPARLPTASDVVRISHDVTYGTTSGVADVIGIASGGQLRFATNVSTSLRVGILLVMPGGVLQVGTPQAPVEPQATAQIMIANRPLSDTEQWGTGLIAVGGRVIMHGAPKTPTFVRTAAEPLAGQTVIQLSQAVSGWRPGDQVFLPDTRQVGENDKFNSSYSLQIDRVTIQSVAADGRSVTVTPLQYTHRGARDANGTPTVLSDGTRLLPHLGNLTRNVIIRSENPSGTRGHTAYTHRADVRIAYVQFQDLGRTRATTLQPGVNQVGRYPLHIHHLWGPINPTNTGYQFELVGNAVNDSLKWPIAVHGSHFGLIKNNVVFGGAQLTGAGIAVEDGSETENRFESNFVAVIRGNENPRETGSDTLTPGSGAECYWAAGFNNRFINNVASDCRNPFQQIVSGPGFKFFTPSGAFSTNNPRFRGADMSSSTETVSVVPQRQPLLEFRGNEVYGGSAAGFTAWHLGTSGYDLPTAAESLISNFRVWHVYEAAVWNYPVNHVTIEGLVYRQDPNGMLYWEAAIQSGDYRDINLTIRGGDIQAGAVFGGTEAPVGIIRIENVRAVTRHHAFYFPTPETPGTGAGIPNPPGITVVMKNNVVSPWPGQPLRTIETEFQSGPSTYPNVPYLIFVEDYQGQAGNNFQVYWLEQATQNIAGGLAPCTDTTTHPEIRGITCTGGTAPPPPPNQDCVVSEWGPWQPVTAWSACSGGTQWRIEERTRTILTQPSGSGASCPSLTETRTVTQACSSTSGGITVTPASVSGTVIAGTVPPPVTLTVTTSTGVAWSTFDTSVFYDATTACASGTCPSGSTTTLTPVSSFFASAAPGTYSSPLTVRASGLPDVVVPVTIVVQSASSSPTPVDCVVSAWSAWQPTSDWSTCSADGLQSRTEQRTRTVVTEPSGGGASCPALVETRTVTQSCTPPPPPPAEVCGDSLDNDLDGQIDEDCGQQAALPGAPRKRTRAVRGSTVNLWWRSPLSGGTPTGYVVEAGTAPGTTLYTLPVSGTAVRVDNVGTGRYYVRVRAVNSAGAGPASNEVTVSVGCTGKPNGPKSLTSTVNGSLVTFTWVDEDGCNDTSFLLAVGSVSGSSDIARVPTSADTLTAAAPQGTYFVRAHTVSGQGISSPSNEVRVVVGSGRCTPPMFGTNLQVQMRGRQVTLVWRPTSEVAAAAADDVSPISYHLQVGTAPGAANLGTFAMGRATGFTTVAPPGIYYVRVRPADVCGLGAASNESLIHVR